MLIRGDDPTALLAALDAGAVLTGTHRHPDGHCLVSWTPGAPPPPPSPRHPRARPTLERHHDLAPHDAIARLHREAFGADPGDTYAYLASLPDFTAWLALLDGEVVGMKVGAARGRRRFHSHEGAVTASARRRGIASALMRAQHDHARTLGHTVVTTNTFQRFGSMLRLNLAAGFTIVGTEVVPGQAGPKIRLRKTLETQ
jgi:GNAT superfamily N-acetyltransferase